VHPVVASGSLQWLSWINRFMQFFLPMAIELGSFHGQFTFLAVLLPFFVRFLLV
jgi:hypothetical protein